uniref:Ig-like domain-containing protein n=1 Tax=Hucho hucho TaxID=62062 RepID=A0A4W5R8A2_9TELE
NYSIVMLLYFYTALPQSTGLPEFSAVTYLDEEPIYFYDSSSKEVVSRQEWVKGDVDPDFWRRNTQILMATEKVFKVNIDTARDCFNQTREDFLIFDLKNERWIAPVRQGLPTKIKWDANVPQLKANIHYLTHTCIEWLKKYVSYQRRMLQRTVSPQVTLLQKEPSNPVTCHATGFYPNAIMIFWGRDGVEIHDDVRTHLTVSPEDLQKHKYSCTVQHSGDDVVLSANRDSIRRNSRNTQGYNSLISGQYITMVILVMFVIVIGTSSPLHHYRHQQTHKCGNNLKHPVHQYI